MGRDRVLNVAYPLLIFRGFHLVLLSLPCVVRILLRGYQVDGRWDEVGVCNNSEGGVVVRLKELLGKYG